jgi:hypothetical protein
MRVLALSRQQPAGLREAVITEAAEVNKILRHLVKIGRPLPGLNPASLN